MKDKDIDCLAAELEELDKENPLPGPTRECGTPYDKYCFEVCPFYFECSGEPSEPTHKITFRSEGFL